MGKESRRILDEAGARACKIVASGDLNEYKIDSLLAGGAPIDAFGVGTELATSIDAPALGGVYKLVEMEAGGRKVGRAKSSAEKTTYPLGKQVFRTFSDGKYRADTIGAMDEAAARGSRAPGEPRAVPGEVQRGAGARAERRMPDVAFWDVDTQNDFMLPGGALYVKGAEKLRPNLRKLYAHAKKARIPVVATADAHSPDDEEMREWPLHCMKGTPGQRKLPETLLPRRAVLSHERPPVAHATVAGPDGTGECRAVYGGPPLRPGGQLILEKCHLDAFTNPCAAPLVRGSGIGHWAVFGVATDYCVRLAALGLLKLGKKVTVVSDAVRGVKEDTSRQAAIEMQAAGAEFTTTAALLKSLAAAPRRAAARPPRRAKR